MDDKRYQIFISSTYRDLIEAREKVMATILGLYHFPVGMEMFSADDDEQWGVIKDTIDCSDYYLLILGHRYGSETIEGISYTEKEYDYAKAKGIPIYSFVRDRNIATKPEERELEPAKNQKLDAFIKKATFDKLCDFWTNEDDLATKVAIALPKAFKRRPRTGWVKADKAISPDVSNEIARLSKENNELKEEIKALVARTAKRRPVIGVEINGAAECSLPFKTVEYKRLLAYPEKISEDKIPHHLKDFISADDIAEYESKLPTREEIDQYNAKIRNYCRVKQQSLPIVITICNDGGVKGHDVIIDLTFPKDLVVLSAKQVDKLSLPQNPMPPSLLKRAEAEYQRKLNPFRSLTQSGILDSVRPRTPDFSHLLNQPTKLEPQISLHDNALHINIPSLLHTRQIDFDEYYVFPSRPGLYEITASIICEEYDEEVVTTISAEVKDEVIVGAEPSVVLEGERC